MATEKIAWIFTVKDPVDKRIARNFEVYHDPDLGAVFVYVSEYFEEEGEEGRVLLGLQGMAITGKDVEVFREALKEIYEELGEVEKTNKKGGDLHE